MEISAPYSVLRTTVAFTAFNLSSNTASTYFVVLMMAKC